jgi:hypothetical protein
MYTHHELYCREATRTTPFRFSARGIVNYLVLVEAPPPACSQGEHCSLDIASNTVIMQVEHKKVFAVETKVIVSSEPKQYSNVSEPKEFSVHPTEPDSMSMTECMEWIHCTDGFRRTATESESDLRFENSAKATILSFRELEKTKRRNIIYFRQITSKIWKETHQRDQMLNMTRRNEREVLSLCETEPAPTCQSSFVDAAVLRLCGGGGSVDTVPDGDGGPQQSSSSPSSPSLLELFNPAYFVGMRVAELKTYANLISPTNGCSSFNFGAVQAPEDYSQNVNVWFIKFDNTSLKQRRTRTQVINGISLLVEREERDQINNPHNSDLLLHQRHTVDPAAQQRNKHNTNMTFMDSAHAGSIFSNQGGGSSGRISGGIGSL